MVLRNREYVQGESATESCEQSGRNINVRKQEKGIAISVVLIVVGRGEVTAGPHGTGAVGLRLKTVCAFPAERYLHPEARSL